MLIVATILLVCTCSFISCDEDGERAGVTDSQTTPAQTLPDTPNTGDVTAPPETGAHTHSFGAWTVVKAPTCTEAGSRERVCSCGEKESESVDATGHKEVIDAATSATCDKTGLTEGKHCSKCNTVLIKQTEIPKIAHTYDNNDDATCNGCGYVRNINCKHTHTQTLYAKEATCTEAGLTEGKKCLDCGETLIAQTTLPALNHTAERALAVAPTCTETGLTEGFYCSRCNEVLITQTVLDALGHTEAIDEAVEPTCTDSGYTEGKYCSVCGEVFKEQTEIAPKGHTEVTDEAVEPTCTEKGLTEGSHCSVCNEVLVAQKEISAKGHVEDLWIIDKPASKTEDGKKHVSCSVCGKLIKEEIIYAGSVGLAYSASGNTCSITGIGTCNDTDIVIPKYIDGYAVTAIDYKAFRNNKNVTSLTFGNNVKNISYFAFSGCESLKNVYFTGTLEEWIKIDRIGVGSSPMCNGADLYIGGALVKDLVIPGNIKIIDECAFEGCTSLESVTFNDGVTNIYANAFYNCHSLKKVTFPNSIKSVESMMIIDVGIGQRKGAFDGCDNLTEVYYTGTLAQWCATSFSFTDSNPLCNGAKLYIGGSPVVDLVVPASIPKIGNLAFYNCTSIKSVTISTDIGERAFLGCTALQSVTLNGNLTLGQSVFRGSSSIVSVSFLGGKITMNDYDFAECIALKHITFDDCEVTLGQWAFDSCTSLESIDFSDCITELSCGVFQKCTSLKAVVINKHIKTVGTGAFANCTSLSDVTIENGVETIDSSAFSGCTALKSIVIPDSVTYLGGYNFSDCASLESIHIGKNVKYFGACTFLRCENLRSVYYAGTLSDWCKIDIFQSVGSSSPLYHGADLYIQGELLVDLVIPADITKIVGHAFDGCTSVKTITVHGGVTTIGNGAFACGSLETLTIENATGIFWTDVLLNARYVVKTIHVNSGEIMDSAFSSCRALVNITLGDDVTSIEGYAFYYCKSLESLSIPEGVTAIKRNTFLGCESLKSLTLPSTISLIDYPFEDAGTFEITYNGTIDMWHSIERSGNGWWRNISTVHCTDGDTEPYLY